MLIRVAGVHETFQEPIGTSGRVAGSVVKRALRGQQMSKN